MFQEQCFLWESEALLSEDFMLFDFQDLAHGKEQIKKTAGKGKKEHTTSPLKHNL